jgi:hypothetical protein
MTILLRLYPRAWRQRYGDELAALLDEQPATLLDRLDLIRGALDARMHPQVPGTNVAPRQEIPMDRKAFGILAAIGGIAWIVATATMFALPRVEEDSRNTSVAFFGFALGIALIGIALGGLGTRPGSRISAQTGMVIGAISLVMAATFPWPWPLFIGAILFFPVLTISSTFRGVMNGVLPSWLVLAFVIATVGNIAGMSGGVETDTGLAMFGLTGIAGLALATSAFTYHARSTDPSPA